MNPLPALKKKQEEERKRKREENAAQNGQNVVIKRGRKGGVSRKNKHKTKKRNMTKHTGKQTKYKKSNTYRK